jgi:hypothetical protein
VKGNTIPKTLKGRIERVMRESSRPDPSTGEIHDELVKRGWLPDGLTILDVYEKLKEMFR